MILLLVLAAVAAADDYKCTTVNGVEGACDLMFYQQTYAGSRLSGAGAYGSMYFWSGISATACTYATQSKSITEQLQMGVRFFDFDVSYIHPSQESLPYWEAGPVLVSQGSSAVAYSRSLKKALTEIKTFMDANRDSVVSMRIKRYYPETREIRDHLIRTLKPTFDSVFGEDGVQLTFYMTLKPLRYMVESNERMVLYLARDFWGRLESDFRAAAWTNVFETAEDVYGYNNCHNPHQLSEDIVHMDGINKRNIPLCVNWWITSAQCVSSSGPVCTDAAADDLKIVAQKVLDGTHLHRPVNFILADYVSAKYVGVVQEINRKSVEYYKTKPW